MLTTAALAEGGFYGDPPDATHPWAIHDMNRPQPVRVEPGTVRHHRAFGCGHACSAASRRRLRNGSPTKTVNPRSGRSRTACCNACRAAVTSARRRNSPTASFTSSGARRARSRATARAAATAASSSWAGRGAGARQLQQPQLPGRHGFIHLWHQSADGESAARPGEWQSL
jgi:hypothetical protein